MMKKSFVVFFLVLFCFSFNFNLIVYGVDTKDLNISGKAAIVMDVETGRILFSKNIHEQLPMASTTKIMTALIAIEHGALDKKVKVNPKAQGIEGSSIYLKANEEIKMIDLIYGLMLRSGNDAAEAIAYEISGSIDAFAQLMNKRAKELGANNTHFTNPHGLSDTNHYTTAYDLALITREALKNPIFKEVARTKSWVAEREGFRHFANKNKMLTMCEGGDGVKTGYTKKSGRCLVASASRNNMQFIAVTLNDPNWFDTTKQLLDTSFSQYKPYLLFEEGGFMKEIMIDGGNKSKTYLSVAKSILVPIKEGEEKRIISVIDAPEKIVAPISKGEKVGRVSTYLNGELITTLDLVAEETIEKQTWKEQVRSFFRFK